jgi:hypothetical protein
VSKGSLFFNEQKIYREHGAEKIVATNTVGAGDSPARCDLSGDGEAGPIKALATGVAMVERCCYFAEPGIATPPTQIPNMN